MPLNQSFEKSVKICKWFNFAQIFHFRIKFRRHSQNARKISKTKSHGIRMDRHDNFSRSDSEFWFLFSINVIIYTRINTARYPQLTSNSEVFLANDSDNWASRSIFRTQSSSGTRI